MSRVGGCTYAEAVGVVPCWWVSGSPQEEPNILTAAVPCQEFASLEMKRGSVACPLQHFKYLLMVVTRRQGSRWFYKGLEEHRQRSHVPKTADHWSDPEGHFSSDQMNEGTKTPRQTHAIGRYQ